jgi:hypothetical protein
MRLDSSGNLGLGGTPSAWQSTSYKVLQIGATTSIFNDGGAYTQYINNAYIDSAYAWRYQTTSFATRHDTYNGQQRWFTAPSGTAGNTVTWTQAMTLDADGRLGVGVTSPSYKLQVDGTIAARFANPDVTAMLVQATTGTNAAAMTFNNTGGNAYVGLDSSNGSRISGTAAYSLNMWHEGAYPICFGNNNAERVRIDSSGNLLVGTTNPDPYQNNSNTSADNGVSIKPNRLFVASYNGDCGSFNRTGSDGAAFYFYRSATTVGNISVTTTSTAYNTSSDYRLKNTIAPMTSALARVAQLKPVTYKWNADGSDGEGFIAHELAEVVPQCVTGEKDAVDENGNPKYQGIDTSFLVATLTAALQEAVAKINSLEARLDAANL